jgi:hypothetical protein
MISILLLLVSMAYSTENEQDLHARLLGTSDAQVEMLGGQEFPADGTTLASTTRIVTTASPQVQPPVVQASVSNIEVVRGMWPLFLALLGAAGFYLMRKKGIKIPGLGSVATTPSVPMKVVSRNALGGSSALLLVDVEGVDGVVRRLLLGTAGNATPSLVTDLGTPGNEPAPIPTGFADTRDGVEHTARGNAAPRTADPYQAFESAALEAAVELEREREAAIRRPAQQATAAPIGMPEDEFEPQGVEPGSDPLHVRLGRLQRHRRTGDQPVASETSPPATAGQGKNWRVNSFSAGDADTAPPIGDEGIKVEMSGSHLELLASKKKGSAPETVPANSSPGSRKRLDVTNAFEAELKRRVYDASPSERKARSDAARALVEQMILERTAQASESA